MSRTTINYKLKYGILKTIKDYLINILRNTQFSLNVDESTSNAKECILTTLVQFYEDFIILFIFILFVLHLIMQKFYNTVEPRYPDTLRTRKKCRHMRSVAVTGGEIMYVYKNLYFL